MPPPMTLSSEGREKTAAQRGGEGRDKSRPLSELQRDRSGFFSFFFYFIFFIFLSFLSQNDRPPSCTSSKRSGAKLTCLGHAYEYVQQGVGEALCFADAVP